MKYQDSWSNIGGCDIKHPFNRDKRAACEEAYLSKPKSVEAQANLNISEAALIKARGGSQQAWSPLAIGGLILASLMGLATMIILIKKTAK